MRYLIYLSTAVELFSDEELKQLLVKSRENNFRNELTGLLLYNDGNFIQVLEGEEAALAETFRIIEADKRHKNIIIIDEGEHENRAFGQWSMGFHQASAEEINKFDAYTDPRQLKTWASDVEHPAYTTMKTFVNNNIQ